MDLQADLAALGQIGLAALLGGLVGIERETRDKPAGVRTHMMVASASALMIILSAELNQDMKTQVGSDFVETDPIRAIVAVMTGVGFLGAGAIVSHNAQVRGITTAGSLLTVSAIGMTVATERWLLAVAVTVGLVIVLRLVGLAERAMRTSRKVEPDGASPSRRSDEGDGGGDGGPLAE